jgi:hypothetical protein
VKYCKGLTPRSATLVLKRVWAVPTSLVPKDEDR